MSGFICGPKVYEYENVLFEFNASSGPWPLKKDGVPKQKAGIKFFELANKFAKLPDIEQENYRVGGGCVKK